MKKIILLTFLIYSHFVSFSQLRFFTDNGKTEVKQGKCGMSDLMVRVPIPQSAMNYDKLRFYVYLTPNSTVNSLSVYMFTMEKEFYSGKKTVDLVLKNESGSSEFEKSSVAGSFMEIDEPCNYPGRSEQYYKISFELTGMKFEKYTYENGEQTPFYSFTPLQKYYDNFSFDYGKADPEYYSPNKSFSITKKFEVNVEVVPWAVEEDALSVTYYTTATEKYNGGTVNFFAYTYSNSTMSLEETKNDIMAYLTKMANGYMNKKIPEAKKDWRLEFYYPCYSKKTAKSGDAEIDKKVEQMCQTPVAWQARKIGNIDAFALDFPAIFEKGHKNDDGFKTSVSSSSEGRTRKLFVFVAEHNGKILVGMAYDKDGPPLTPEGEKFMNDAINSFKAY